MLMGRLLRIIEPKMISQTTGVSNGRKPARRVYLARLRSEAETKVDWPFERPVHGISIYLRDPSDRNGDSQAGDPTIQSLDVDAQQSARQGLVEVRTLQRLSDRDPLDFDEAQIVDGLILDRI